MGGRTAEPTFRFAGVLCGIFSTPMPYFDDSPEEMTNSILSLGQSSNATALPARAATFDPTIIFPTA